MSYFRERGFRDDIIKKFQLGYSLEQRNAFSTEALKSGYQREYLLKTGLAYGGEHMQPLTDRFRGRVIFPIHTLSGKVVAFGGRILKKSKTQGNISIRPKAKSIPKAMNFMEFILPKMPLSNKIVVIWSKATPM